MYDEQEATDAIIGDEPGAWMAVRGGIRHVLEAALQGARVPSRSYPWFGWLVVALVRYRERQRWALASVGERTVDRAGDSEEGVAELRGWKLQVTRWRTRIVCEASGEAITLPIDSGRGGGSGRLGADTVDSYGFAAWIESLVVGGGPSAANRRWDARHRPERFAPCLLPNAQLPEARSGGGSLRPI